MMGDTPVVGIVGAYGETGSVVARELLQRTDCDVILAGRDLQKAQALAGELGERARPARVDVYSYDTVAELCEACDVVVNCAGPSSAVLDKVATVCIQRGCHYVDPGGYEVLELCLKHHESEIQSRGLSLLSSAGFLPGLTEVLPFYVEARARELLDSIDSVEVYTADRNMWSRIGLLDSVWWVCYSHDAGFFKDGRWKPEKQFTSGRVFKYPRPIGRALTVRHYKGEFERFAADRRYKVVAGYVGGYSLRTLLLFARIRSSMKRYQEEAATLVERAFARDCRRLGRGSAIVAIVKGRRGGKRYRLTATLTEDRRDRHYWITGLVPAVATAMLLDGRITTRGHRALCDAVDPVQFMGELARAGVTFRVEPQQAFRSLEARTPEVHADAR